MSLHVTLFHELYTTDVALKVSVGRLMETVPRELSVGSKLFLAGYTDELLLLTMYPAPKKDK